MVGAGFQGFLRELRRRRVFRVAALYLAAAFGVLEAADILTDVLRLPPVYLPSLTVLVILGFPLSLAIGWTFDVAGGALKRTGLEPSRAESEAADGAGDRPAHRWPALSLAAVSLVALTAAGWTVRGIRSGELAVADAPDAGDIPRQIQRAEFASIAVMPFLNLSGDPANDYFGDGLAEEIGNVLSRIEGLRVAARTSAFALKGRDLDARRIGDTLGVGMLLEGSVRRAGDRVRVGAQLVRTADGLSLWSDSWDRELSTANVFAIQDEITRHIANELEQELLPQEEGLAEQRTTDLQAYDLYLLGRHRWAERSPEALAEAIDLFERAIARDSAYAPAWTGLADAWEARPFFDRSVSMARAEPIAREAAARALALAPGLADAHATVGVIDSDYGYDYSAAIRHLQRAVELNPSHAQAWSWLCVAHTMGGDAAAGLPACDRAVTLDPLYPVPRAQRALALMALERHEEALEALESAEALGPLSWILAVAVRLELGREDGIAEDLVRTAAAVGLDDPRRMETVARAIRGESPAEEALPIVRDLEATGGIGFLELAPLYAWIGAEEEAMRVFREAVAARDPWLPFAAHVTSFDALRDEPGFRSALESLGVPMS